MNKQDMINWLKCFHDDSESTVEFEGVTYPSKDCVFLGAGSIKQVFQPKGTSRCFIIPRCCDTRWDNIAHDEKKCLDEILGVGLSAQRFDIVPLTVKGRDGTFTINAIATTSFKDLCKAESLIIYDGKARQRVNSVIGDTEALKKLEIDFTNPAHLKKMLHTFYQDYVTGVSFKLPIKAFRFVDDSEHYCLELPKIKGEFPQIRYMFWDVVPDFEGISFPKVPNMQKLNKSKFGRTRFTALATLIGTALADMMHPPSPQVDHKELECFYRSTKQVIENVLEADNEPFLNAIEVSRKMVIAYYRKELSAKQNRLSTVLKDSSSFRKLVCGVVSTQDLELVKELFSGLPHLTKEVTKDFDEIIREASQYPNQHISDYLQQIRLVGRTSEASVNQKQSYELFGFFLPVGERQNIKQENPELTQTLSG